MKALSISADAAIYYLRFRYDAIFFDIDGDADMMPHALMPFMPALC